MDNNKKELDALNLWPTKSNNRIDVITPHKITVVFLVQEYLNLKQELSDQMIEFQPKYRRKFSMLLLKLIQYPDLPYKELHNLLTSSTYGIHPDHLSSFDSLMDILNTLGIEILFDLQKFIDKLMTDNIGVNQFGILGLYIRRIVLALDKLTFPEMMTLYNQIKRYYEKGIRTLALQPSWYPPGTKNIAEERLDINPLMIKSSHNKWSVKQADLFVAQQCNLLENNETRALPPIDLQLKLSEIIQDNPLYSQAHILSYMNNLRVRDFYNSLDAFHRAFDRSAVKSHNPPETKGFQYSSLNLAIMHAQFNHNKEALASLRECVMLAQECGDRICLQLAQSWLCLLDKKYVQLCEKSVASQTELSLVHSVSLGVQFIVNVAAVSGFLPSKLFELLMKSEVINFQHSLMDLMANCIAQKAAVWTLYGKNEIASLCSQLLLHVVRTHSKRENDSMENGEGVCHSLCCVALWLSLQGEFIMSAIVLQHARERFPRDPLARNWMICESYVTSMQAMYKSKWDEASKACCQLYTLDKTVSTLQRASMCIMRRNVAYARKLLETLLKDVHLEPLYRVRAMILMSNTLMVTSDDMSADVINILNEASIYAKSKYLAYEVAIIDVNFSYVLLTMGMPGQALKTIRNSMDTVLADGGLYDSAKTMFLFVKCLIAAQRTVADKVARLCECLEILDDVINQFNKVGALAKVKDVHIYMATMYHEFSMITERNKCALKFRELEKITPTPTEFLNVFF